MRGGTMTSGRRKVAVSLVTPTAQGFSGTLDGSIAIYDSLSILNTAGRVLASCRSATHAFTLVR